MAEEGGTIGTISTCVHDLVRKEHRSAIIPIFVTSREAFITSFLCCLSRVLSAFSKSLMWSEVLTWWDDPSFIQKESRPTVALLVLGRCPLP